MSLASSCRRMATALTCLLIPYGAVAQVQSSLFRAGDGTAYHLLVASNLGGGAERLKITTLAGSLAGASSCSGSAGQQGQPTSAIGGVAQTGMTLHAFDEVTRTAVLTPNDIGEVDFDSAFGGRLTLGTGGGALNVCRRASDCTGSASVQTLVGLESAEGGVPPACIAAGLAAQCNGFVDRSAFAFGVPACGFPPICTESASVTVNATVCAPEPLDGFTLADGQAIVFVYEVDQFDGFAAAVGGFGVSSDPTSTCPGSMNGIVSATGDNDSPHVPVPPTHTPTITPGGPATPTFTRTATSMPRPDVTPCNTGGVAGTITYADTALPVALATIHAAGATSFTTTSDAAGAYSLSDLMPTSWNVAPRKTGGVGLAVSALDAAYVLQALAELRDLGVDERLACDVTGNGTLSTLDATRILQFKVGLISRLPLAGSCDTDWLFVPNPAFAPNQTVHNPLTETLACPTGSIVYNPLEAAITDQDFRALVIGDCTGNWTPPSATLRRIHADERATVRMGRVRDAPSGRIRVPIAVRAQSIMSLEIELRVSVGLDLHSVRASGLPSGSILQAAQRGGRVRIAAAYAHPTKAATLVVTLEGSPSDAEVLIRGVTVNELPAQLGRPSLKP